MTLSHPIATIFGGTGFVGTQIVRELANQGYRIKVITRIPESAYFLKPCGDVGQIVPIACDYSDNAALSAAIKGSDIVINCIGVLYQKGKKQRFARLHTDLPAAIAAACKKHDVKRFVQISALACERGTSKYAQSKIAGEKAILKNFPDATILRPSIIFGEDDSFFNMFASMAQILPALPLIGGGHTKFQPVYVGDVADAVMATLAKNESKGQVYELGGPDVLSFRELFALMFEYTGQKRCLISLPFWLAKIQAFFLSLLPKPLLTPDQVQSLKTDNVCQGNLPGLHDLGIQPTNMRLILPRYLELYRAGGKFTKPQYN